MRADNDCVIFHGTSPALHDNIKELWKTYSKHSSQIFLRRGSRLWDEFSATEIVP